MVRGKNQKERSQLTQAGGSGCQCDAGIDQLQLPSFLPSLPSPAQSGNLFFFLNSGTKHNTQTPHQQLRPQSCQRCIGKFQAANP